MTRKTTPVLLVDANDDVREGLRTILETEGWSVEASSDPREALNKLVGGFTPCIILLDLMSSAMNGVDFQREMVMSRSPRQQIPLVAYSGLKNVRAKARALMAGAASDLPAEIDRVLAAVRHRCSA